METAKNRKPGHCLPILPGLAGPHKPPPSPPSPPSSYAGVAAAFVPDYEIDAINPLLVAGRMRRGGFSWRERRVPLARRGPITIMVFVIVTL